MAAKPRPELDERQLAERRLLRAAGVLAFIGAAVLLFGLASPVCIALGIATLGLGVWLGFWVGIHSQSE